jgi:O-antigen ligase
VKSFHKYRLLAREALRPGASDNLDSAAFVILLLFVAIAPFLYAVSAAADRFIGDGSMLTGGTMLIELFAFLLFAMTLVSRSPVSPFRPIAIPLVSFAGVVALGLIQLYAMPERVLERIAPVNLKIYHETNELLRLFGKNVLQKPRISISPIETSGDLLVALACVAVFLSAASLLRNRLRRAVFGATILATASIQILLFLFRKNSEHLGDEIFPTREQLAVYLEIALAVGFGMLWAEVLTNAERAAIAADRSERLEKRILPLAGKLAAWGVIGAGIVLTQSRSAILAATVTAVALLTMAIWRRSARLRRRARARVVLALFAAALFAGIVLGGARFVRLQEARSATAGSNARIIVWKASLEAWKEFRIFGSGLGTFREAIRRAQPRELPGLVEQAHSEWLELLVTGGVIGATLGIAACTSLLLLLIQAWGRQRHREESAVALAGFGALLSLTLHGLVDLSFSIPLIASTLACSIGAAWAAGAAR